MFYRKKSGPEKGRQAHSGGSQASGSLAVFPYAGIRRFLSLGHLSLQGGVLPITPWPRRSRKVSPHFPGCHADVGVPTVQHVASCSGVLLLPVMGRESADLE